MLPYNLLFQGEAYAKKTKVFPTKCPSSYPQIFYYAAAFFSVILWVVFYNRRLAIIFWACF